MESDFIRRQRLGRWTVSASSSAYVSRTGCRKWNRHDWKPNVTVVQGSGCTAPLSPSSTLSARRGNRCVHGDHQRSGARRPLHRHRRTVDYGTQAKRFRSGNGSIRGGAQQRWDTDGTITAAGQSFTVAQDSGCSAVVSPDTFNESPAAGSENVNVTTAPDCAWTATSNAP